MTKAKASFKNSTKTVWAPAGALPWILLLCGLVALVASFVLGVEKFNLLKNPHYVPVCNLNPILNCGTIASSHQAEVFGFSNDFIGLAGFAALATVGTALLAGARFKRWFWQVLNVGLLLAVSFVTWLQFETLYRIGALCLFCMVVWAAVIPAFWYTTLYNLGEGHIKIPNRLVGLAAFARRHHGDILLLWYLIIIALILKRFWYYWSTLF